MAGAIERLRRANVVNTRRKVFSTPSSFDRQPRYLTTRVPAPSRSHKACVIYARHYCKTGEHGPPLRDTRKQAKERTFVPRLIELVLPWMSVSVLRSLLSRNRLRESFLIILYQSFRRYTIAVSSSTALRRLIERESCGDAVHFHRERNETPAGWKNRAQK